MTKIDYVRSREPYSAWLRGKSEEYRHLCLAQQILSERYVLDLIEKRISEIEDTEEYRKEYAQTHPYRFSDFLGD